MGDPVPPPPFDGAQPLAPAADLLRRGRRVLAAAGEVGSPCVSICRMGEDGLCAGCLRTLPEIAGWSRMGDAERRAVWATLLQRARQPELPCP